MPLPLAMRQERHSEAAPPPAAARSAAHRSFGNMTSIKETSYKTWGWSWLESFLQDLRYGIRSMFRTPTLTLVALLSLALGIGANTAIFSFLDALMLRSLPRKDPPQLVVFHGADRHAVLAARQ